MTPKYPRELIERYRAQDFKRAITERAPVDLEYDEVTLSCGHKRQLDGRLIRAANYKLDCEECGREWADQQLKGEANAKG